MTPRERFCKSYDFENVDRPMRWEAVAFWQQTVDQWIAAGTLPRDADPMEYYGFDPRPGVTGGLGLTSMAMSGEPIRERVVEEDGHTQVIENDLGLVRRVRSDGGESMPTWIRFPVESHEDWRNKIKPRLRPNAHAYEGLDAELADVARHDESPVGLWLVGLYAFWRNFWGEQNLAYAFYDFPRTLHEMTETWLTMHCECTPRILEAARIDYVLFHEDMAYKNGPLIGPTLFDDFMAGAYRDLFAHLRAHGQRRLVLDSDGNNGEVLERFIRVGMNGLYPFEQAAGCDVLAFRERHPDFFIWGGIDKRVLLTSQEAIRREVLEKVPAMLETGGYAPSIDHAIPPCPQANFEYFLELVRSV